MFVKKGHRLSLQYHNSKDETLYVQQGKGPLEMEEAYGKFCLTDFADGQCAISPPGTKHWLKAIQDVTLLEVSTAELEDVVRVKDDYGREYQQVSR